MIEALAASPLSQALAWALVHSLWQGLLLALVFGVVLRATRSAPVRYVSGLAAMALLFAAFAATIALSWPAAGELGPAPAGSSQLVAGPARPVRAAPLAPPANTLVAAPYLSMLWLAGVALCHAWQFAGLAAMIRLRRRGLWPAVQGWQRRLTELAQRAEVTRRVALMESVAVETPCVAGHLRPFILLPAGLVAGIEPAHLEAILLHELAHIRRHDYLVHIFQRWLESLFFYHPALWWISNVVRAEREVCCDEAAVLWAGRGRGEYAEALAALEAGRGRALPQPAVAFGEGGGSLRPRIERLLRPVSPSPAGFPLALVLITAVTLAMGAWWIPLRAAPQPRPVPESPYQKWIHEDVLYIVNEQERAVFLALRSDEEREQFIGQFWERREAMKPPGITRPARSEHYRRIAYANQRFPSASAAGWKTDRGRIYIVWGPPDEIESHPAPAGGRAAYEQWLYRPGNGLPAAQIFTFVDERNTGDYRLQSQEPPSPAAWNRLLRWAVVDEAGRYVTGLTRDDFVLQPREGPPVPIGYFEAPGVATAVAVVVSRDELSGASTLPSGEPVIVAHSRGEALDRLRAARASRKILLLAAPLDEAGTFHIPGGLQVYTVEPGKVREWLVLAVNQYAAGYRTEQSEPPQVRLREGLRPGWAIVPVAGLP